MDGGFVNLFDMSTRWRKVGGGDDWPSEIRCCLTPSISPAYMDASVRIEAHRPAVAAGLEPGGYADVR